MFIFILTHKDKEWRIQELDKNHSLNVWKNSSEVKDFMIISGYGRNLYGFKPNVIYRIYDYLLPTSDRVCYPMVMLTPVKGTPQIFNIEITSVMLDRATTHEVRFKSARSPEEIANALRLVDKEYSSHLRIRYNAVLQDEKMYEELIKKITNP